MPKDGEPDLMKTILFAAAILLAGSCVTDAAFAKGCLKGAVVGGVGGHMAGHHGMAGAAAGCAVGHHMASKKQKAQSNPPS